MKRFLIIPLALVALLTATAATNCAPETRVPADAPAIAAGTRVIFKVSLIDDEGFTVEGIDTDGGGESGWSADMSILILPASEDIVAFEIISPVDGRMYTVPVGESFDYVADLTHTMYQIFGEDVSAVSVSATAFLFPGWTLTCSVTDTSTGGRSESKISNDTDLPIEMLAVCIWPVATDLS